MNKPLNGPDNHELIDDPEFEKMAADICRYPQMFVREATYDHVCQFILAFDAGRGGGGPLLGIHPWHVTQLDGGNNELWIGVLRRNLALDTTQSDLSKDLQEIQALGHLLQQFFEYRRTYGLTKIFYDYGKWLLRRQWYRGPLRTHLITES